VNWDGKMSTMRKSRPPTTGDNDDEEQKGELATTDSWEELVEEIKDEYDPEQLKSLRLYGEEEPKLCEGWPRPGTHAARLLCELAQNVQVSLHEFYETYDKSESHTRGSMSRLISIKGYATHVEKGNDPVYRITQEGREHVRDEILDIE